MSAFEIGTTITHPCLSCFYEKQTIMKVTPKEFSEKTAYVLWTQCASCGRNDTHLRQSE
ncbi:hypothetical protein LCM20_07700 [Halobacillus litoralis]|uniref:hypothetical protein n=1 Tax=Halobacillus litoralis TaxID=45668 RepID=UPI001CD27066|nr:hypothetical protein [Halobacillus litoralis]MCA0970465.1 hypothetical protein [Halobacillus litoralis]